MANYKFIAREDIGTREEQQDSHIVITGRNSSIAVVCDGLGGMQGGRIASQCIKKVVQKLYTENEPTIENAKFFSETFVNESIHAIINEGKIRGIKPMSTLTVLLLFKDVAFYTHVGDSRIYFFNNSFMKNRTKDHSILQILVDKGSVREEDMGTHPDQNKLYQCLGQADKISFTFGLSFVSLSSFIHIGLNPALNNFNNLFGILLSCIKRCCFFCNDIGNLIIRKSYGFNT